MMDYADIELRILANLQSKSRIHRTILDEGHYMKGPVIDGTSRVVRTKPEMQYLLPGPKK